MSNYVLVQWPESQDLMEEEWFKEEAIGAKDNSYFIPTKRILNITPDVIEDKAETYSQDYNDDIDGYCFEGYVAGYNQALKDCQIQS